MLRHQIRRIETMLQSQTPVIQMLNEISATMVTKREFMGHRRMPRIYAPMKPCVNIAKPTPDHDSGNVIHSIVTMRQVASSLPIGEIRVSYGCKSKESGQQSIDNECTLAGAWEFHPAPWLSHRIWITRAMLFIRCGIELERPSIFPTL